MVVFVEGEGILWQSCFAFNMNQENVEKLNSLEPPQIPSKQDQALEQIKSMLDSLRD